MAAGPGCEMNMVPGGTYRQYRRMINVTVGVRVQLQLCRSNSQGTGVGIFGVFCRYGDGISAAYLRGKDAL